MSQTNQKYKTFEDLQVWQEAIALAEKIYQITSQSEELSRDRSLVDQLRRASVSVSANISEGFERQRHSKKEYLRFLSIAKGSAGEVRSLLTVAHAVGHIDFETFWLLKFNALDISKMLGYQMKCLEKLIIETEKKNKNTSLRYFSRNRSSSKTHHTNQPKLLVNTS
ncbi:four helix bundle protein [Waterburya agarophytonicola K14]|uniref:Four helix bundle protein n=1 Tax=Waterburya agarophytonicola KI4 TaxID=2874699 RepID=A0A964FH36_9CYAN|nr:four helix bundle protein [Waterburya agarophytonicola]MCC0178751.1 four helix bundle protein [Waterburya agarophytonicola KI4]